MAFRNREAWLDPSSQTGGGVVEPFDIKRLENANYLMAIGHEVYVSAPDKPAIVQRLSPDETFEIAPGQFAFLLTEEVVSIPTDAIGFISIRSKQAFRGLVNISGFHVDPGYNGKLLFSVFNAGPTRIVLRRGDPIFPMWLADFLTPSQFTEPKPGYQHIPSEVVSSISGEFTSAYQVQQQLNAVKAEVEQLKLLRLYVVAAAGIFVALFFDQIKTRLITLFS